MFDILVGMKTDIEMLKTAFGNSLKVGPVAVVDAAKGYRLKLGSDPDGADYLSPWYPHPESGGQSSSWMPLSVGQIVGVINPGGDPRQGVLFRAGFSAENAAPSTDLAANVLKAFGVTMTVKDGALTIEGNVVIKGDVDITGDQTVTGDVDFKDGHVEHNSKNIGDTHVHGGVEPGGSTTSTPE